MTTSPIFVSTDSSLLRQKAFDLLEDFIRRGTLRGYGLGDSNQQQRFEEWVESPDTEPRIYLDPNKLDLREFRNPYVPVGPGEFLERDRFLLTNPRSPLAQSPSFDINRGGDARRARKGLTPSDVERLIEANPDFGDHIREMYLPGPSLPKVRKASVYDTPALSPTGAEALAGIEYMNRGRTPDFNPAAADMYVRQRAEELMRS